jgi:hypothetical protein
MLKECKYSMDDLAKAMADYGYAKARWEETQHQLNTKRAAIESLEKDEALAVNKMSQCEVVVRRIMKDME